MKTTIFSAILFKPKSIAEFFFLKNLKKLLTIIYSRDNIHIVAGEKNTKATKTYKDCGNAGIGRQARLRI